MNTFWMWVGLAYLVAAVFVAVCAIRYAMSDEYEAGDWSAMVFTVVCPGVNWVVSMTLIDAWLEDTFDGYNRFQWQDRLIIAGGLTAFATVLLLGVL